MNRPIAAVVLCCFTFLVLIVLGNVFDGDLSVSPRRVEITATANKVQIFKIAIRNRSWRFVNLELEPGCGCTTGVLGTHQLIPYGATTLTLVVDTQEITGPFVFVIHSDLHVPQEIAIDVLYKDSPRAHPVNKYPGVRSY